VPDDELVPVEIVDEEPPPAPGARPPWPQVVTAAAAVVGALALCVVAWAEVGQERTSQRSACVQEAQLLAFSLQTEIGDPRRTLRERARSCGVDLPTGEEDR
jgi:hypothetical protein